MKKLGVLLLAAAFAVFGLMTFAACNEETLDPGDDPIVTPEPDDPDDPDDPGKPEEPDDPDDPDDPGKPEEPDDPDDPDDPTPPDEPEATEGLEFELITTESDEGFEEFFGEDFEDFYACIGMTASEENVVIPTTYNGLSVRAVLGFDVEPEIANGITGFYIPDSVQIIQWNEYDTFESLTEIR